MPWSNSDPRHAELPSGAARLTPLPAVLLQACRQLAVAQLQLVQPEAFHHVRCFQIAHLLINTPPT